MGYTQLDARFFGFLDGGWIWTRELVEILTAAERTTFSKAQDRRSVREMFNSIQLEAPFGVNQRMPAGRNYVYRDDMDWNNKFMTIYASLASGDSYQSVEVTPGNPSTPGGQRTVSGNTTKEFNDAATAFYNTVRTMRNQIAQQEGVWFRAKLELRYVWVDRVVPVMDMTMRDLVGALAGGIAPERIRFGNTTARLSAVTFPGAANTIHTTDGVALPALPADGTVVYLWLTRSDGRRTRIGMRLAGATFLPEDVTITATTD